VVIKEVSHSLGSAIRVEETWNTNSPIV